LPISIFYASDTPATSRQPDTPLLLAPPAAPRRADAFIVIARQLTPASASHIIAIAYHQPLRELLISRPLNSLIDISR